MKSELSVTKRYVDLIVNRNHLNYHLPSPTNCLHFQCTLSQKLGTTGSKLDNALCKPKNGFYTF